MAGLREPHALDSLLRTEGVGRSVVSFDVYGINSLKTLEPPLASLQGEVLKDVKVNSEVVLLVFPQLELEVDLARTGQVHHSQGVASPSAPRSAPPTGRLVMADDHVFQFREPGKTKRITFSLRRTS